MALFRMLPPAFSPLSLQDLTRATLSLASGETSLVGALQNLFGSRHVLLTDTGTSALRIAIQDASSARSGAPCLLPAYGCFDLATAAIGAGVAVRLYDVDPYTLAPEMHSLERAAASGASSIVVVHQYGVPVALDEIQRIAVQVDALVIEDTAQGLGSTWRGQRLGVHGDYCVLSFGRGKGATGGGGALLSQNAVAQELAAPSKFSALCQFPTLAAQSLLSNPWIFGVPARITFLKIGQTRYKNPARPRRISGFSSKVVLRTLARVEDETRVRQLNAQRLLGAVSNSRLVSVDTAPESRPGWLRFPVMSRLRGHVVKADSALGITRGYPVALSSLPQLANSVFARTETPGSNRLARELVTLPTHSLLTESDLVRLEDWIRAQ